MRGELFGVSVSTRVVLRPEVTLCRCQDVQIQELPYKLARIVQRRVFSLVLSPIYRQPTFPCDRWCCCFRVGEGGGVEHHFWSVCESVVRDVSG